MHSTIGSQLNEAATLLLVGMGFVFIFLTLLIGAIKAIEAFCIRFPGPVPATPAARRKPQAAKAISSQPASSPTSNIDAATVAAITAAIHTHRHTAHKQEKS